jgi:glycogen debranching enzyme
MPLTILEGSTFCICDERGDIGAEETSGFFTEDTRFLSHLRLTINGEAPLELSSGRVEYFSAAFFLRNPLAGGLPQDALLIVRERFVGVDGMQDRIVVENQGHEPHEFELGLELGADFADIFLVKARDFALGDPLRAAPLPEPAKPVVDEDAGQILFADDDGRYPARTQVVLSRTGAVSGSTIRYPVALEPRERWDLQVDVYPVVGDVVQLPALQRRFGEEQRHVRESLAAWQLRVPGIRATWDHVSRAFSQSVSDLASLRMRADNGMGQLPAAGMPWFMTVFGRDTIITCLQTLLFGPELARTALHALADLQADADDPESDAEPGKIVHEVRRGKGALAWHARYYGTVDATPLYLVLLSEVWRWTDDAAIVRTMREPAMRALEWIDRYGDRDGDGFVEYQSRSSRGIKHQSWKDSGDSQRFSDGRYAEPPIAPVEVQGYVYDAKRRVAELAREVWRDRELAARLEREADELMARFNDAFWTDDYGGRYGLGLDRDKQLIDALGSNVGHLLWSGIVPPERVDAIVDQLLGPGLWSGWGVRTMSANEAAYNPLSYHNGSIWPHDNSLIVAGLVRSDRWPEAQRIVQRMFEAAKHFSYQLPEVFAGLPRTETPFPIPYPTAARPQAWAAGTPVLMLQSLLGLQPDRRRQALTSVAPPELPSWAGSLRLSGVRAFGRVWDVRLEDGRVRVEQA